MKKIILAGVSACVITIGSTMFAKAQTFASSTKTVATKSFLTNVNLSAIETYPKDLNTKALRHFIKSFQQAEDVHWYNVDDGVMAYFVQDGIKTRADYTLKGAWLHTLRSYPEKLLPKDVRIQVKYAFIDYDITWVNEITTPREIIYMVHIEDATGFKTIRLCNGELEIAKEFLK